MLNWWFREPSISNINATTQNEEKQDVEEVKEEIPEYIWVDGYKGKICKDIIIFNMSLEKNTPVKEHLKFARTDFTSL